MFARSNRKGVFNGTRQQLCKRAGALQFTGALTDDLYVKRLTGQHLRARRTQLRDGLLAAGFDELPIRAEHVLRVAGLPWRHRDPFDRLLVCQAAVEGLTLLTADTVLASYGKPVRRV